MRDDGRIGIGLPSFRINALTDTRLIELTADIVSAHVSNNNTAVADVPALIQSVFTALTNAEQPATEEPVKAEPAVPVRSSVKHDYIVCLEDGKKLKMLKRYLRTNYAMTPDEYRAKWGLPRDYPMVAPAYAEQRRGLAKAIGLGRKKVSDVTAPVVKTVKKAAKSAVAAVEGVAAPAPKKRGRPAKVAPQRAAAPAADEQSEA
jgi:predicted transcriptional regulator